MSSQRMERRGAAVLVALVLSPFLAEGILRYRGQAPQAVRAEVQRIVQHVQGLGDQSPGPAAKQEPVAAGAGSRELHPYLGWDARGGELLLDRFVEQADLPAEERPFCIWFTGGSVAEIFVGMKRGAAQHLEQLLADHPVVAGRKVVVCRLARAGYKQPQQLLKLTYLLARGGRPDLVINLDGLNEVRQGMRNLEYQLPLAWPVGSHWKHLARSVDATSDHRLRSVLEQRRGFLDDAREFLSSPLSHTALLGGFGRRRLTRQYAAYVQGEQDYLDSLGARPKRKPTAEQVAESLEQLLELWADSSRAMHDLCEARGIAYLHLLQPTLHDPGSKVPTAEELECCIGPGGLIPEVGGWYRALRERGRALAQEGIPFVDTSRIFAEVEETLYFDRAHFGRAGNLLLAERIHQELAHKLKQPAME